MRKTTERDMLIAKIGMLEAKVDWLRQRAERAEAAIARVRELHFVEPDDQEWCYECNVVMPCPTLRALDGDA